MRKKDLAVSVEQALEKLYPDAVCSLEYKKDYELLFAVRLSAQCTDARVNIVCREMYSHLTTLESIANADIKELEEYVKTCGLYRMKAKNIKDAANMLITDFNGRVPSNMDDLLRLPGVGRKTANLILGDIYGQPAVVTDTHCIRICGRLGLTTSKEPYKVEMQLKKILTPATSSDFCHRLVIFGREYCTAQRPKCDKCPISSLCGSKEKRI